jgi:hypothetical protein
MASEQRSNTVIQRSRKKGDAMVALVITGLIIIVVLFLISLFVVVK